MNIKSEHHSPTAAAQPAVRLRRLSVAVGSAMAAVLIAGVVTPASAAGATPLSASPSKSSASPAAVTPVAPNGSWITAPAWAKAPKVGGPAPAALPVLAKDFSVGYQLTSAVLSIAGQGVYNATIDGQAVSRAVLEPGYSVDTRAYYSTYDVTALLSNGSHRIGVGLGSGMWAEATTPGRYSKLSHVAGPVAANATLTMRYANGAVAQVRTDTSWRATLGATTIADWYGGEDYNASRETPNWELPGAALPGWGSAVVADMPASVRLTAKIGPPIAIKGAVAPRVITQPQAGVYVVDFGRQVAGWPVLNVSGPAGTTVKMTPAESLGSNGLIDPSYVGLYDSYTLAGNASDAQTWHPNFVYHGFRYVQLEGLPSAATLSTMFAAELSTAATPGGSFASSDAVLNKLHLLTTRSISANSMSVLTDCPDREKLGWLEETHLVFDALASYENLGYRQPGVSGTYGARIVQIIADAQTPEGLIPDIAPEYTQFPGAFRDDVNWGSALVDVPWKLYQSYGDSTTMGTYYGNMQRYLGYLNAQIGQGGPGLIGSSLGDWFTEAPRPNGAFYAVNNSIIENVGLYNTLTTMTSIARVLGKSDVAVWADRAAAVANAINAKWLTSAGDYGSDQAANAITLAAGIVPAANIASTRSKLLANIAAAGGQFKVGEVSIGSMFAALSAMGRDDIAYKAVTSTAARGYGAIARSGATSLTEGWGGSNDTGVSQTHFMLGVVDSWMSQDIAGLKQAPGSVNWAHLDITPQLIDGMTSASATHVTNRGTISVGWTRPNAAATATVTITLPPGTTATVNLPSGTTNIGPGTHTLSTAPEVNGPVYSVAYEYSLFSVINGNPTHITLAQWAATGYRAPIRLSSSYQKTSFAPSIYAVTNIPGAQNPLVEHLLLAGWTMAGYPPFSIVNRLAGLSSVPQ